MVAESREADERKNLIRRSGRIFLLIANVNEKGADDGNMNQVDPEIGGVCEVACEGLVGLVDDENDAEAKERLIDLLVCIGP